jgi:RHS repeat-associated protein
MGEIYEQLEYTPYGELWVEHVPVIETTPFRFTGKERDGETGLYYFGARYLNPQTSMWLSADPAMGEYIPQAPINDEAKKHNENLPGMGGVFNYVNLHAYHYAGNNSVKLVDPGGEYLAIAGDEDTAKNILDKMNSASFYKYEMQKLGDDTYLLYRSENSEVNRDGSRSYSKIIDALCYDKKSLNIMLIDEDFLPEKGEYSAANDSLKVTMVLADDSKTFSASINTKTDNFEWNTSTLIVFNANALSEKKIIHGLITAVLPLSIDLGKKRPSNLERQVKFELFLSRIIKN